jgi:hypothetical protein
MLPSKAQRAVASAFKGTIILKSAPNSEQWSEFNTQNHGEKNKVQHRKNKSLKYLPDPISCNAYLQNEKFRTKS